jgi:glycosyltransferase involved in cell wall biosynthesis
MAMGKAIVATDVGDISRFIEHGKSGFIVPPESPEKLAEYVGRLVENPELRAAFGSRAREIAVAELDVSIVARHHAEAYESILNY